MGLTMSHLAIGAILFACVMGGALVGMFLRNALPEHHLASDSKDVIKLGMGLVATTDPRRRKSDRQCVAPSFTGSN
jgi:hypothetical protein